MKQSFLFQDNNGKKCYQGIMQKLFPFNFEIAYKS